MFFINMSCKLDMYLYLADFNLMIFLFVQFSNQPPIINTYLNISICLCSIHSKRLSCMNVGSCICKCFLFYMSFMYCEINEIEKEKKYKAWVNLISYNPACSPHYTHFNFPITTYSHAQDNFLQS